MYILHFPARTSALKDGRLNERSNHEQEDNSFDLCGGNAADGGVVHTNVPKVARLGADMLSFDSEFVSIDAPYFFEASELNYIDVTYYYTY